jgi:hypothetical protein
MQLFAEGCTGVAHNHLEVAVRSLRSSSNNADAYGAGITARPLSEEIGSLRQLGLAVSGERMEGKAH